MGRLTRHTHLNGDPAIEYKGKNYPYWHEQYNALSILAHYEDLEEVLRTTLTEETANVILSSPHDFKEWLERGQFYVRKIEEQAVDFGYLSDWYISSVDENDEPVWTEKHIRELIGDFILIPRNEKSEVL